jgi:hypothetical protein
MNPHLSDDVLRALVHADRKPGWNARDGAVRRFNVDGCDLYVVPFKRWAYRRIERQAEARLADQRARAP